MNDRNHPAPEQAQRLLQLHTAPELLTVVNVWDPISAAVVAEEPGTKALATAGHSIAASHGYPDGEIPLDLSLAAIARIVAATDLPVTADLDAGYGDPGETVRRAVGVGVVGANLEDRLAPLADSVRAVEAALAGASAEGVELVLNARTDAFVRGGDRSPAENLDDAIERGRAYLDAGAPLVFVPGLLDESQVTALVDAFGRQRLTVIHVPGSLPLGRLEELGAARVSFGPWSQRVALTALQDLVRDVHQGRGLPEGTRALN